MNTKCPQCSHPVKFWDKLNSSSFKPWVCPQCESKWQVSNYFLGIAACICIPVFLRYFLDRAGIVLPSMVQFLMPIPLIYVIFKFLLPLVAAKPNPLDRP